MTTINLNSHASAFDWLNLAKGTPGEKPSAKDHLYVGSDLWMATDGTRVHFCQGVPKLVKAPALFDVVDGQLIAAGDGVKTFPIGTARNLNFLAPDIFDAEAVSRIEVSASAFRAALAVQHRYTADYESEPIYFQFPGDSGGPLILQSPSSRPDQIEIDLRNGGSFHALDGQAETVALRSPAGQTFGCGLDYRLLTEALAGFQSQMIHLAVGVVGQPKIAVLHLTGETPQGAPARHAFIAALTLPARFLPAFGAVRQLAEQAHAGEV